MIEQAVQYPERWSVPWRSNWVNAIHPSMIGDSPYWTANTDLLEAVRARVPTRRLVTTDDVVDAVLFLLANRSMNGTNLLIDGGELLG